MQPTISAAALRAAVTNAGRIEGYRQALGHVAEKLRAQAAEWVAEADAKRLAAPIESRESLGHYHLAKAEYDEALRWQARFEAIAAAMLEQRRDSEHEALTLRDAAVALITRVDMELERARRPKRPKGLLLRLAARLLARKT